MAGQRSERPSVLSTTTFELAQGAASQFDRADEFTDQPLHLRLITLAKVCQRQLCSVKGGPQVLAPFLVVQVGVPTLLQTPF
jgi:hypothetical protein